MKKRYNALNGDILKFLIVYLISAVLMFVMRLFLYPYIAKFILTIVMTLVSLALSLCFGGGAFADRCQKNEINLSKRRCFTLSSLIFASGVLIAVPLIYLGNYIGRVSGLIYSADGLFDGSFVLSLIFVVIIPSVFIELFFRRAVYNVVASRCEGRLFYIVGSLLFSLFFFDVTLFAPTFVMCIIFALIEKVAKSRVLSVSCSLIWGMILYFFGFMLSLDKDGVNNLGFVGIFGMFFMFSAVAATVLYIVFRQLTKSKASYVEITTVAVLIGLTFIIGCVMTSL